jgi:Ca2+/Na+ antiporter
MAGEALSRNRKIAVWSLVGVATLVLLVGSLTVWVKRQALDTDAWVDASGELLANDEIRAQLSIFLIDSLFENTDAEARIAEALPPERQGLAPLIAGALRDVGIRAADRFLGGPRAQELWEEANRRAHENLLAVLEGEDVRRFTTEEGTVALDLSPIVERVGARLGVEEQLEEDAGVITILESDELETAQTSLKVIKAVSVLVFVLVFVLYGLAIYLAAGRRREILRASALSFILVGLLLFIAQRFLGDAVVNSLVEADATKPAGREAWWISTELLRGIAFALVLYGIVALVGAWLAGPTRPATAARRWVAPSFREQPWIVYGVVAFLYLLVIAWGPTPAMRQLWGIVLFAVLVFFGVYMLQRQTLDEFPESSRT